LHSPTNHHTHPFAYFRSFIIRGVRRTEHPKVGFEINITNEPRGRSIVDLILTRYHRFVFANVGRNLRTFPSVTTANQCVVVVVVVVVGIVFPQNVSRVFTIPRS